MKREKKINQKRTKTQLKKTKNNFLNKKFLLFALSILSVFLTINIYSSQSISPLYLRLVNNEKKAVIEYLKKIKNLPQFKTEIKNFTGIFGREIAAEVFFEDEQRKIKIKKLEAALQKNPKSRDVLYALSKLYQEDGNYKLADKYLKKTKEVDPMIE